MATVKYRLRSQAAKNVTIYVYLSTGKGEMYQCKTGFTIHPKDWKSQKSQIGVPKQNNEINKKLFNDLKKLESHIFDQLNSAESEGIIISKYWLEKQISECFNKKKKTDRGLLLDHIQYIIDNANTRKVKGRSKIGISESRVKGYKSFKELIKSYQTYLNKDISLLDISKPFITGFTNWLMNIQKYSVNYSGKAIDNLKTVCLDAESLEIKTNSYVKSIQSFKEEKEDRHFETLSFEELKLIEEVQLNASFDNARKWLLIGCEIGQRVSDLLTITKENLRYSNNSLYIDIVQQKTKKEVTIGVVKPTIKYILENEMPHQRSTQKFNEYIKDVCRIAEIDELKEGKLYDKETRRKKMGMHPKYKLISSHVCRRSFATNYYRKIPTAILIHYTGHGKESEFLKYIGKPQDKDENANLFMKFYEEFNKEKEAQLKAV